MTKSFVERVHATIRDVPDFPTPGVLFKDITPLLADGKVFAEVIDHLAERFAGKADVVAGVEARGFLLSAPLAVALGIGSVVVRKAGKLPPPVISATYDLEYGTSEVEVSQTVVKAGQRVVLLDDVLATGGTAAAAASLLEQAGMEVVGMAFLMELSALGGRTTLADRDPYSILTF